MAADMPGTRLVYLADREADMVEMMCRAHELGAPADWLVRAKRDRCLAGGEGARSAPGQLAELAQYRLVHCNTNDEASEFFRRRVRQQEEAGPACAFSDRDRGGYAIAGVGGSAAAALSERRWSGPSSATPLARRYILRNSKSFLCIYCSF
jgi:hypothetical protein